MKKYFRLITSGFMAILISIACNVFADNPIIQTKYTADPAPMVWEDTVYLYTTHDEDDATGFTMYDWLLYSSTDMVNWTDHGVIAGVRAPNKTFSWSDGYNAWAAQCIPRNGKFYLYVPTPQAGKMVIGVAVANSPTGPFTDPIGKPLVIGPDTHDIDPSAFIDSDGQAYLYWGHQKLRYVKLNADMTSYSGSIVELSRPQTYEEGPWIYKRNSNYYLAWASTCCPEGIGYAMSTSPTGPWTYKNSIMDGNSASDGNHPGIIDFKGSTYCFGLNYDLLWLTQSNKVERRSVALEKITYSADGTIPKIPFWTKTGVTQLGTVNPYDQTQAETICWAWQLKSEVCSEGGIDICNIENGDYIKVKGIDFGTGATSFEARVASATSGGNIQIRLDSQTGTLVGTCAVSGTGGWQTWATRTCTVSGATGIHDLYFVFTGGSGSLFNFNWWKFSGSGPTSIPTAVPTIGPTPVPGFISIACGNSSAVESFQPDQYYSGGSTFNNTNTVDVSAITVNPPPAALFNNERYGAMTYTIPGFTAGNSYEVILYFAETYLTSSGSRLFNVSINGTASLSDFDIYASAGGQNKAIARSFTTTADSVGQIVIQLTAVTENPKINGIAISPVTNNGTLGDVNGSGTVDIVDALLVAQYYVGLNPSGFLTANADVNCSGSIDIVDALLVAQYYVGLVTSFTC